MVREGRNVPGMDDSFQLVPLDAWHSYVHEYSVKLFGCVLMRAFLQLATEKQSFGKVSLRWKCVVMTNAPQLYCH